MPNHRIGRLSEDIKRELSALLRELKDPAHLRDDQHPPLRSLPRRLPLQSARHRPRG